MATLGLCVDLNVLTAWFLAEAKGRHGTSCQVVLDAIQQGQCSLGPVQLIISWSMLSHWGHVLQREFGVSRRAAELQVGALAGMARLGPAVSGPHLVMGRGADPIHDPEDGRVMDVAQAGRAHLLVTANMRDFVNYQTTVVKPDRIALYDTAVHHLVIGHPYEVAAWIRMGTMDITARQTVDHG